MRIRVLGIAPGYCADELHVGRRVHPYHAYLALPSHHQDAGFTTSAALYDPTVASPRRHVPVRQAVRMTGIDSLKVPDARPVRATPPSTDREPEAAACNTSPAVCQEKRARHRRRPRGGATRA